MFLRLLVPDLCKIERELEQAKRRSTCARQAVVARGERAAAQTAERLRSPLTLAAAGIAGFAGGRLGSTSRRLRDIEDQLADIERLVVETSAPADDNAYSRGRRDNRDGLDFQALLANVTRIATLLSMVTSQADSGATGAEAVSPDTAVAHDGEL